MGSSNVTNASVVCVTGVANANLNGTFKMVRYSFGPNYGDVGDLPSATVRTRDSRRRTLPLWLSALLRQVHLLEYRLEARIAVEATEQLVDFDL
jgi:hypothetical protein